MDINSMSNFFGRSPQKKNIEEKRKDNNKVVYFISPDDLILL